MQDILAQMQEKLKATGQVGPGIGLRGRVGSLGNDLDATDVEKKRNSIIDVWIFKHRFKLGVSSNDRVQFLYKRFHLIPCDYAQDWKTMYLKKRNQRVFLYTSVRVSDLLSVKRVFLP